MDRSRRALDQTRAPAREPSWKRAPRPDWSEQASWRQKRSAPPAPDTLAPDTLAPDRRERAQPLHRRAETRCDLRSRPGRRESRPARWPDIRLPRPGTRRESTWRRLALQQDGTRKPGWYSTCSNLRSVLSVKRAGDAAARAVEAQAIEEATKAASAMQCSSDPVWAHARARTVPHSLSATGSPHGLLRWHPRLVHSPPAAWVGHGNSVPVVSKESKRIVERPLAPVPLSPDPRILPNERRRRNAYFMSVRVGGCEGGRCV